jgi:hypothetical protein
MPTFTFSVASLVTQADEARRAKGWRDFEMIMREGVWWFGSAEVKDLLTEITKRPKEGRPPDAWIHERILAEYDAAVLDVAPKRVNKAEFARNFYKKYRPQLADHAVCNSPGAVLRMLNRLLKAWREAEAEKKAR